MNKAISSSPEKAVPQKPEEPTQEYVVRSTLIHDGVTYLPESRVRLKEEKAKKLIAMEVVAKADSVSAPVSVPVLAPELKAD